MDTHKYCWPTTTPSIQNSPSLRVRANEDGVLFTADILSPTAVFVKGKPDLVIFDPEPSRRHGSYRNEYTNMIDGQHSGNVVERSEIRKTTGKRPAGRSPSSKISARRLDVVDES
jgi:hypothetical protein